LFLFEREQAIIVGILVMTVIMVVVAAAAVKAVSEGYNHSHIWWLVESLAPAAAVFLAKVQIY
jgi:hypothetical protein